MQAYLGGGGPGNGRCPNEPKWTEIQDLIPPEGSTEEQRIDALAAMLRAGIRCRMLRVVPTACHRCQDNPANKAKEADAELVAEYQHDIFPTERLHDAVRMGLVRDLRDLTPEDFDLLRIYWWEMEKILRKASIQMVRV